MTSARPTAVFLDQLLTNTVAANARPDAARQRAATERAARVEETRREVAALQQQKEARKTADGAKARCSTTDPEARQMKMGDGGFRPAYNEFVSHRHAAGDFRRDLASASG